MKGKEPYILLGWRTELRGQDWGRRKIREPAKHTYMKGELPESVMGT